MELADFNKQNDFIRLLPLNKLSYKWRHAHEFSPDSWLALLIWSSQPFCLSVISLNRASTDFFLFSEECTVGHFFDTKSDACQPCATGFYQDEEGKFYCKPCEVGLTTKTEGSDSEDDCIGKGTDLFSNDFLYHWLKVWRNFHSVTVKSLCMIQALPTFLHYEKEMFMLILSSHSVASFLFPIPNPSCPTHWLVQNQF